MAASTGLLRSSIARAAPDVDDAYGWATEIAAMSIGATYVLLDERLTWTRHTSTRRLFEHDAVAVPGPLATNGAEQVACGVVPVPEALNKEKVT
jgi:hypothetical protein